MKRILVVDDEPTIREVIGEFLHDEGYGVLYAASGRSMIKVLETERPDLILLDLMMPDGDGWEAHKTMQGQPGLNGIPVIVVSTGMGSERMRSLPAPYLVKPFSLEQLVQIVRDTIGESGEAG